MLAAGVGCPLVRSIMGEAFMRILTPQQAAAASGVDQGTDHDDYSMLASPAVLQLMLLQVAAVAQAMHDGAADNRRQQRTRQVPPWHLGLVDALNVDQQAVDSIAANGINKAVPAHIKVVSVVAALYQVVDRRSRAVLQWQQQLQIAMEPKALEQQQQQEQQQQEQQQEQQQQLLLLAMEWGVFMHLMHVLVQLQLLHGSQIGLIGRVMQAQLSHLDLPLHDSDLQQLCEPDQDISQLILPLLQLLIVDQAGRKSQLEEETQQSQAALEAFNFSESNFDSSKQSVLDMGFMMGWVFVFGECQ
jgi:hypothetical protein